MGKTMKILHVVGARPNFMKIAPIMQEMQQYPDKFSQLLVHTGQHYDDNMSKVFFDELGMPVPNINLNIGSGSHAWQTAQIMLHFEPILLEYKPEWIFIPGDVNSTLACALVASKIGVKIAHVEAGLRSFDRSMPEEINRLLTDQISDILFTPSSDADENLLREGIDPKKIFFVGNVMIDTLVKLLPKASAQWPSFSNKYNLDEYILVTLHRPVNVDTEENLYEIMSALNELSAKLKVLFPVHPRTRDRIKKKNFNKNEKLIMIDPVGYLEFLALQTHAKLLLTDSGGIQEETTYLRIPCLTIRPNTERPITIKQGTNRLIPCKKEAITEAVETDLKIKQFSNPLPLLWDGMTSARIVSTLLSI